MDPIAEDLVRLDFPAISEYRIVKLPYGRIVSNPVIDSSRIISVGRFSQWDHRITMEHVISKLIKLEL